MTYQDFLAAMQQSFEEQTSVAADDASDIGIRFKALATQLALLAQEGEEQFRQLFPQTATGSYLELHCQLRGIERKTAQPAAGQLVFSRRQEADYAIEIPEGTVCAPPGDPSLRFVTTQSGVLPAGELSLSLPAQAQEGGKKYNLPSASVTLMILPPLGITDVTNPLPFSGGTDGEEDESLRQRLLKTYREISNGANAAYYRQLAMVFPEITSCAVLPRARGRGTVDVVLSSGGNAPGSEVMEQVETSLQSQREIGVDVAVKPVVPFPVDLSVEVEVRQGYSIQTVTDACRQAIAGYFSTLQIGEPLLPAALGARLFAVQGVGNYHLLQPEGDILLQPDQLAVLRLCEVTGEGML